MIEAIVQSCQHIRVLQLFGCHSVNDYGLKMIADMCSHLRSLDLSRTSITDDGLCYFASGVSANTITELLVNECSFVTTTSVGQLFKCCKNMRIFCFNGTRAIGVTNVFEQVLHPIHIRFDVPIGWQKINIEFRLNFIVKKQFFIFLKFKNISIKMFFMIREWKVISKIN